MLMPASVGIAQRPPVSKTIPGYGPAARDAAISGALQLAASGLYTE